MIDDSKVFWVQESESDSPQAIGWPEHRNQEGGSPHVWNDLLISLPIHLGSFCAFVHIIIQYISYILYQYYLPQPS